MLVELEPRRNTLPWDVAFVVFAGSLLICLGVLIGMMVSMS